MSSTDGKNSIFQSEAYNKSPSRAASALMSAVRSLEPAYVLKKLDQDMLFSIQRSLDKNTIWRSFETSLSIDTASSC